MGCYMYVYMCMYVYMMKSTPNSNNKGILIFHLPETRKNKSKANQALKKKNKAQNILKVNFSLVSFVQTGHNVQFGHVTELNNPV